MIQHANRGQSLEQLIEYSNEQYRSKGWATIQKVSTPWKVIRSGKQIISAFPERKSTVDFIGVASGKAIAFDAKSTQETMRFPLANIEEHQIEFLRQWQVQGGTAFFLIEFAKLGVIYKATLMLVDYWYRASERGGKKSIPHETIEDCCHKVGQGRGIALDYLDSII